MGAYTAQRRGDPRRRSRIGSKLDAAWFYPTRMTGTVSIHGVAPVVPTPFHPDESIDVDSLRPLVDWIARSGLAGMCLPAYGSEFYKLSDIERDQVVSIAIAACDGRVPVIAQANHVSARLASELARRYDEMGADVISFAIPRQFSASTADILDYCETIASATSLSDPDPGFQPRRTDDQCRICH